jgi:Holliday junction resolvase
MKLKVTSKGVDNAKEVHEQNQKRGKRSKVKGANYERDIAKKFKANYDADLTRTPQSGGFAKKSSKADDFRGDIVSADKYIDLSLHIECKNTQTWTLPKWFEQAEGDCPKDKAPVVIFHKYGTGKDYIALSLEDFFQLVPRENVITERKERS